MIISTILMAITSAANNAYAAPGPGYEKGVSEDSELIKLMGTAYKTTSHPEMDQTILSFYRMIEGSTGDVVVYSGGYEECIKLAAYFNYEYGYTMKMHVNVFKASDGNTCIVKFTGNSAEAVAEQIERVKIVQEIAAQLKCTSDIETMYNVANWVAENTAYETEYDGSQNDAFIPTYYNVFTEHKSLCKGMAMAVYQLCSMDGIHAEIQEGHFYEGLHAWNVVTVNGTKFYIDATSKKNTVKTELPAAYQPF